MTKNEEESILRLLQGKDISEVMNLMMEHGNGYSRRILRFFRGFCKYVPICIMCFHACGVWEFSQHPREMFILVSENDACYAFIYFMLYILPMVIIVASRFFWLCWRYRIPLIVYYLGVNSIHISYGSIFTTNDMVMSHFALFIMTGLFYLYGFAEMFLTKNRVGKKICA